MDNPIRKIEGGVCWFFEEDSDSTTRHKGEIWIYDNWVRLGGPVPTWIPRESVDQIHES